MPAPADTAPSVQPVKRNAISAPSVSASPGSKPSAERRSGPAGPDSPQAAAETARRESLQARWGLRIQRRVHRRLIYPRGATGTGTARVALTIDRSGRLAALRLTRSSGVAAFDRAALSAVRRAGRFPPAPEGLDLALYSFSLSLSFRP